MKTGEMARLKSQGAVLNAGSVPNQNINSTKAPRTGFCAATDAKTKP
jgi:hypothetical protein